MNTKILIALPILTLLVCLGTFYIVSHNDELEMGRNKTTIFEWLSCFSEKTQAKCDDLNDTVEKNLCYSAGYAIGQLTYADSPNILESCQKFQTFYKNATSSEQLNTENYYQDCFMNPTVLKAAYQNRYFNDTIFYPIYINCAGF